MSSRRKKKTALDQPALEADAPASGHPIEEIQGHAPCGQVYEEAGPQSGPQPTSSDPGEEFDAHSNNIDKHIPDAKGDATPIDHHEADPNREPSITPDGESAPTPTTASECDRIILNEVCGDSPGTEIVVGELFGGMLDAGIEEPNYPAHEWQGPADPPLVLPDEAASNEALIEGARRLVQIVSWRMRRTVQEWWMIGRHLAILKERPENEGRWRKEILPEIGVNHETDNQLRRMSEMVPFEACLNYTNKTELLRDVGILPPKQPKLQIGFRPNAEAEEIPGLGDPETYDFGGVDSLPHAAPIEEIQPDFGMEPGPQVDVVADAAAQPSSAAPRPRSAPKPEPQKVAAKAASQPGDKAKAVAQPEEEHDPIAEGEALVVTLGGAKVADMEAALSITPFTVIAKTEKRIVGLLWYAEDDYKQAKDRAGKALENLRNVKNTFQIEARYLCPLEVIAL